MGNHPNHRTQAKLSRQIDTLRAELHEKEIEWNLFESYLWEGSEPDDPNRMSDEVVEHEQAAVLEECEILESKLVAATKAWSGLAWRELDRLAEGR